MIKRSLLGAALMITLAAPALANAQTYRDAGGTVVPGVVDRSNAMNAPAYCQVSVPTSSTSLTALLAGGAGAGCAVPAWVTTAILLSEATATVAVRCAADATALSATLGLPIAGGQAFPLPAGVQGAAPLSTMKCVSATGAAVTMDVWFEG